MKKVLLTVLSTFCTLQLFATDPTTDPTDTKEVKEDKGKFTFSGYADSYYFSNFNRPKSRNNLGAAGTARAFDQKAGQFSLGLVQTKMVYSNDKSEAVVDLAFGPNADLGNYGNLVGPLGSTTALAIKQAYFTWKASPKFSLTAGQFGTHIGYEVIDAPVNYNYSLSNLFNNGPFYHIGVKGTLSFSEKSSLMFGLVNNVDGLYDNNRAKGIIAQYFISPASGWNVYLNWIGSNEANVKANGKDSTGFYSVLDLTTTYQITDKFFLGLNAAYGSQKGDYQGYTFTDKSKTWGGVALYTNYAVSSTFGLGARYEIFDNSNGARLLVDKLGNGTSVNSFTITSNITLADGHLLFKPELRIDSYKKLSGAGNEKNQQFEDSDGNFTKNSQATLGMAMIYKF